MASAQELRAGKPRLLVQLTDVENGLMGLGPPAAHHLGAWEAVTGLGAAVVAFGGMMYEVASGELFDPDIPIPTGACYKRAGTSLCTYTIFTEGRSILSRSTENGPAF